MRDAQPDGVVFKAVTVRMMVAGYTAGASSGRGSIERLRIVAWGFRLRGSGQKPQPRPIPACHNVSLDFDSRKYGDAVSTILELGGDGRREMPLAMAACTSADARRRLRSATAGDLLPGAVAPAGALSGLWLYFGCFDEAHAVAQDDPSVEGSYWHAILHRQEPDPGNASYWFRRVGSHAIFPSLRETAADLLPMGKSWDPFAFVEFCERARREGGAQEAAARKIQLIEWQLLFDHCARSRSETQP